MSFLQPNPILKESNLITLTNHFSGGGARLPVYLGEGQSSWAYLNLGGCYRTVSFQWYCFKSEHFCWELVLKYIWISMYITYRYIVNVTSILTAPAEGITTSTGTTNTWRSSSRVLQQLLSFYLSNRRTRGDNFQEQLGPSWPTQPFSLKPVPVLARLQSSTWNLIWSVQTSYLRFTAGRSPGGQLSSWCGRSLWSRCDPLSPASGSTNSDPPLSTQTVIDSPEGSPATVYEPRRDPELILSPELPNLDPPPILC